MLGQRPHFESLAAPLQLRSGPWPSVLARAVRAPGLRREALVALGIETVRDLLEHLPHAHRAPGDVRAISSLAVGERAVVVGVVESVEVRDGRPAASRWGAEAQERRSPPRIEARLSDGSGALVAVWFNQLWLRERLRPGQVLRLEGVMRRRGHFWVREHEWLEESGGGVWSVGAQETPAAPPASPAASAPAEGRDHALVPVHPAGSGVSARRLRKLVERACPAALAEPDPLPPRLRARERLPDRAAALVSVHFPRSADEAERARARLAFEELLLLQLALGRRRQARRERARAPRLQPPTDAVENWLRLLPFAPTGDQQRAIATVRAELASEVPMNRLLMGEVGSGKTLVAAAALLHAAAAGYQAVLMAPTETLAEQHHRTLDRLLGGHLPLSLLTASIGRRARERVLRQLATGELLLVVGTHALIEPTVTFRRLGLAVIDEQHRFGVHQRATLETKGPDGRVPHVLHMTATPIPRTLALTAYGDLDVTVLRELPRGRQPVETLVLAGERGRREALARVRAEVARGHQAFIVCPLVEESEALAVRAATAEFERLASGELSGLRLGLVHGQLPAAERQRTMGAFARGELDVLVATSVIEVGIDVPNATVMVVEAAERWGIAQLHQLRGRVGRGAAPGVCILLGDPQRPRLRALAEHADGFQLAEIDLELRGAGDVLGTRQHGLPELRFARLPGDSHLLERARAIAADMLARDPDLAAPEHVLLATATAERFGTLDRPIPA